MARLGLSVTHLNTPPDLSVNELAVGAKNGPDRPRDSKTS